MGKKKLVAVIGGGQCSREEAEMAEAVGRELARRGMGIVCGGLGGVMEAACRGAEDEGGITVGILPGDETEAANPYVQVPVVTGLGVARNAVVIKSARAVIAIGGSYGTLSEIAFARQLGVPVVGLNTWALSRNGQRDDSILTAQDPGSAVDMALALAGIASS